MRDLTLDEARSALQCISPDGGHDERARMAMAIYAEFGADGEAAWKDWAAGRSRPDAAEDRDTWRSAKGVTKLTIGTLIKAAQDKGWQLPRAHEPLTAAQVAEQERIKADRQRRHALAEAQYRARADQAARDARELWDGAAALQEAPTPYTQRKAVGAYGTRALPDGTLLVPMRDAEGKLQNVQRIAPQRPEEGSDKRFLPGGRKQGLSHLIGPEPVDVLLMAEGYATAATLREALLLPVVVAFDAGNLRTVAQQLPQRWPGVRVLVCADNDHETESRTGKNPGVTAARSAVRVLHDAGLVASWCMPEELPAGGSDFNDLEPGQGPARRNQAVRRWVEPHLHELVAADDAAPQVVKSAPQRPEPAADEPPPWVDAEVPHDAVAGGVSPPPSTESGSAAVSEADGSAERGSQASRSGAGARRLGGGGDDSAVGRAVQVHTGMLRRFALVYATDAAWDHQQSMLVKVQHMRLALGRKVVNEWLEDPHRHTVMPQDLLFEPGQDVAAHQINMFTGLELDPVPCAADEVAPMLELLRHLCAESEQTADEVDAVVEWVLRWIALPLQQLGTKMQTALVFHGAQGTGKNLFFDAWRDLYGVYGITVSQTEIEDKFNGWVSRKLAIVGDEVVSRQEMYHNKNRLKLVVTQGTKFAIRGMMMETRWESNHANVVFLSNESMPLALEERDRRYMVVYTPLEADASLYQRVRAFLAAGGAAKWLHYLQTYPLDGFEAHTKPIMTRAKQDLIEANWRPSERFAHEWLSGYLDLPVRPCTNEQLYEAFTAWAARNGERWPPSQSLFSGQINRWANEQRRRDPATGRLQDARLVYKVITVDPPTRQRKSRRCFLPAGTGPADGSGQTEGQWMHECIEEFDALLGTFRRRRGGDALEA